MSLEFIKTSIDSGVFYGYPLCCIMEFCRDTPEFCEKTKNNPLLKEQRKTRFKASHKHKKYTGFIPCYYHAVIILNKPESLEALIKNRNNKALPFPLDWSHK